MNDDITFETMIATNSAFADRYCSDNTGITVTIHRGDAEPMVIHIPATEIPNETLSAMEQAIVQAIAELEDGAKISTEALAAAAGYAVSNRFRDALGKLSKLGLISSLKPGYGKP